MVDFRDINRQDLGEARLETPRHAGFRHGMSATHLIGTKLANVYEVTSDLPLDIGHILRGLDGKARGNR